jgi:hypothetical protein
MILESAAALANAERAPHLNGVITTLWRALALYSPGPPAARNVHV